MTFEKLLLIGVIAAFLIGPDKLPHYAQQLGKLVRNMRDYANGAKDRVRDEMGPEFDDVDWQKLDPRQYDPRRIIRDALTDEPEAAPAAPSPNPNSAYLQHRAKQQALATGELPPFDNEAT
nr:twin-arginine translocase TatA/TatE family subunit [Agromyces seonyuensis]